MMNQSRSMPARPNRPFTRRFEAWQLMPAIYLILGAVILVAQAMDDNLTGGLIWFAVFAVISAVYAFGGRFETIKQARGDLEDERDAAIHTRAMAAVGLVFVVVLTGCIVFELARGHNPAPYSQLMAFGGGSYIAALLYLRARS